jgi:hypothetical protein
MVVAVLCQVPRSSATYPNCCELVGSNSLEDGDHEFVIRIIMII